MRSEHGRASHILLFLLGLVIGSLLVGGFFYFKFKQEKREITTSESSGIILSIDQPNQSSVVNDKMLKISGTTGKDSTVAISSETENKVVQTNGSKFSLEITLSEGENKILIAAFDRQSGENAQTYLNILYLNQEINSTSTQPSSATASSEKINQLKEKISTASAKLKQEGLGLPKSHIFGTLVAASGQTLWIQTETGNTQAVIADDLVNFYNVNAKGREKINQEDLKIGDKLAVAGVGAEEVVGNAKFVVKMDRPINSHVAVVGSLEESTAKNFKIKFVKSGGDPITVKTDASTKIFDEQEAESALENITKGSILITIGSLDKGGNIIAAFVKTLSATAKSVSPQASPSANQ